MSLKYKRHILEAIDLLRGRKARPDIDRICSYVQRRYFARPQEILADLERLLDEECVIKVEYKGSVSYRNAAKWPRYNSCKTKPDAIQQLVLLSASERTFKPLVQALNELIDKNKEYLHCGVPLNVLQEQLIKTDELKRYDNINYLNAVIARELNNENIELLDNSNVLPASRFLAAESTENPEASDSSSKPAPKNTIKPWMLDEIKRNGGISSSRSQNDKKCESEAKQTILAILNTCKTLKDVESKKKDKKLQRETKINSSFSAGSSSSMNLHEGACEQDKSDAAASSSTASTRVGSRRKRARQVFDPSDNNLPRSRGTSSSSNSKQRNRSSNVTSKQLQQHVLQHKLLRIRHQQTSSPVSTPEKEEGAGGADSETDDGPAAKQAIKKCIVKGKISPSPSGSMSPISTPALSDNSGCCLVCKEDTSNKTYRLVTCQTCDNRVHPLCLKNLEDLSEQPPMKHALKWRCMHCHVCSICGMGAQQDWLAVCQVCEDSFHATCHSPVLLQKPTTKWLCYSCVVVKNVNSGHNLVNYSDKFASGSVPVYHVHTAGETNGKVRRNSETGSNGSADGDEIAEVSSWSCDDVAAYFCGHGFQEEATLLKDQDIDGKSLLLMQRNDILRGFGLKIGPALKIFSHVNRMQQCHFGSENGH